MVGMRGYVGVTDEEWFRFLAARPEISEAEVNFWRPGGSRRFQALEHGEPFFFKTHAPHNRVVGAAYRLLDQPPPDRSLRPPGGDGCHSHTLCEGAGCHFDRLSWRW